MRTLQERKRRDIMRAAEELFTSRRFHEITLEKVAEIAGVGKGTIYLYFKDKDDLFFQTALAGFDRLLELLAETVPAEGPFERRIAAASLEISRYYRARRKWHRMMQSEDVMVLLKKKSIRFAWLARRKALITFITRIFENGAAEKKLRTDIPARTLANILAEMLRIQAMYLPDTPAGDRQTRMLVDLFYRGAERKASAGIASPRRNKPA
jgi:AcrR family transcriptional regulator